LKEGFFDTHHNQNTTESQHVMPTLPNIIAYAFIVVLLQLRCIPSWGLLPAFQQQDLSRRNLIVGGGILVSSSLNPAPRTTPAIKNMVVFQDPNTYASLLYMPPLSDKKLPVIVVLHGAGTNQRDITNLADLHGEYGGLLPSLIANDQAPAALLDNFIVLAPYCYGAKSFYDEPRSKMLNFIAYALENIPQLSKQKQHQVDQSRVFLFGFSDGATLGVELLTTRRFAGAVICSYGYTGTLPNLALQRLAGLPMWVFHSADDVIFQVERTSDPLVESLKKQTHDDDDEKSILVKYTRFDKDPEGFTGSTRGHTTGITASRDPHVYQWLLSLGPTAILNTNTLSNS
jgi:predicted peptidase